MPGPPRALVAIDKFTVSRGENPASLAPTATDRTFIAQAAAKTVTSMDAENDLLRSNR